jgi:putative transposase
VNWDVREAMTEADIEIILQGAKEKYPEARPRIISDNGPQFIAKDFKEFIRISGMTHARTSPLYPQSNGKIERWHKSLKGECIRPGTPLSLSARRLVRGYVDHYNNVRLNSATGFKGDEVRELVFESLPIQTLIGQPGNTPGGEQGWCPTAVTPPQAGRVT